MSLFSKSLKPLVIVTGLISLSLSGTISAHGNDHDNHHKPEEQHRHASKQTDVMVMNGYARATFALAKTGAVYFTLHNQSKSDKTLISVLVPQDIASDAQIHTTVMQDDVMKMRELTEGVKVKAGQMIAFEPGGRHIMLLGLTKGLKEGSEIALTLKFDDASEAKVRLPVRKEPSAGKEPSAKEKPSAKKETGDGHHHHH
ncbi:copper chaperone PCu(A)C [Alteromonas sp. HB246098]